MQTVFSEGYDNVKIFNGTTPVNVLVGVLAVRVHFAQSQILQIHPNIVVIIIYLNQLSYKSCLL